MTERTTCVTVCVTEGAVCDGEDCVYDREEFVCDCVCDGGDCVCVTEGTVCVCDGEEFVCDHKKNVFIIAPRGSHRPKVYGRLTSVCGGGYSYGGKVSKHGA